MSHILIGHGSGGKLSKQLIREVFLPHLSNDYLKQEDDAATLSLSSNQIVLTTDAFTVSPLFFPGGDIGKLAVCGTVNDLVVCGAKPKYVSASFIIEEGFSIEILQKIVQSFSSECKRAGVDVVTADTKVVEKGKVDGLFITTSGVGELYPQVILSSQKIAAEDQIIVSGEVGNHGAAIAVARGELNIEASLSSDCASLHEMMAPLFKHYPASLKQMRDATRGGVATVINEFAEHSHLDFLVEETSLPICPTVSFLCEMLGFSPLYLANEGTVVMIVASSEAKAILSLLQEHPLGRQAKIIGEVLTPSFLKRGRVYLKTSLGSQRILDMLVEDPLPRIC